MDKSLLYKVKSLEKEADERVVQVQEERRRELLELKNAEAEVLDEVRVRADKRAKKIIDEYIGQANEEVNQLKQEREKAVRSVHEQAGLNSNRAVEKIEQLFKEKFIK
jgi:vacuolar-type H+-ATPase subunit H